MDLTLGYTLSCFAMSFSVSISVWKLCGWVCVALGIIGVMLPVMPTVPFLLLATYCFERGSPLMHAWLMQHKTLGPPLVAWRKHRVIKPRAKLMSVGLISTSVIYVVLFRTFAVWIKMVIAVTCVMVMIFILLQRNRPPDEEQPLGL